MSKNINAFLLRLGMQTLTLLQEDGDTADGEDGRENSKGNDEAQGYVGNDERKDANANGTGRPDNVTTLKTQELKGPLKPLEYRRVLILLS